MISMDRKQMKLLIYSLLISVIDGYFTGCPMDGCESTLTHFVDLNIDGFDREITWKRTDLLTKSSRGCVSDDQKTLICAVDRGYVSLNVTNGQILSSVDLDRKSEDDTAALPIVNYAGFAIVANSSQCTLINPQGDIAGVFHYTPELKPPLSGPFVTDDGQIIVADSTSFVGIEDSGIPLGVQSLPSGYVRQSRSMSLMRKNARWYLIVTQNQTSTRAIVAAETSGSIVSRIRLVWTFNYGFELDQCSTTEGPILFDDQSWLFVVNKTGLVVISDQGNSANVESIFNLPNLCVNDMAFSSVDSTVFILDRTTLNIIVVNVSTKNISQISLKNLYEEEIVGQLSKMIILSNHRLLVLLTTSTRKAVLLLIDSLRSSLVTSLNLGPISEIPSSNSLSQMTLMTTNNEEIFLIFAHPAVGLNALRLVTSNP